VLTRGLRHWPANRCSFPIDTVSAFDVKTARTVAARDASGTAGKFGLETSQGVTVTGSPIVSSMAAETTCIPARQLLGNSVI
jgi:hypothetical protein